MVNCGSQVLQLPFPYTAFKTSECNSFIIAKESEELQLSGGSELNKVHDLNSASFFSMLLTLPKQP